MTLSSYDDAVAAASLSSADVLQSMQLRIYTEELHDLWMKIYYEEMFYSKDSLSKRVVVVVIEQDYVGTKNENVMF